MTVAKLSLEHSQQVGNDVETLREETDALVHLQVTPDGLVHGLELGFHPEQLRGVEDGAVEVDADAEDEELADLHVDLRSPERNLARRGYLGGDVFARFDG